MGRAGGNLKTWADVAGLVPPSRSIDRDAGEGPPRCCARRLVAADALVHFGELSASRLAKVRARFPEHQDVPAIDLYLCDGCRGTIRREVILTRDEEPNAKVR